MVAGFLEFKINNPDTKKIGSDLVRVYLSVTKDI